MSGFNYDKRRFVGVVNYDDGDLTAETVFVYHQRGKAVWGTVEGGRVLAGTLVAKVLEDGCLDMVWQYLNTDGRFVTGTCSSKPEIMPDGRYRLHEVWRVHGERGEDGTSVIEEVRD